nr:hypothetical protein [Tanacetum cinerariifolium]
MVRRCTHPKRPRNAAWFKKKLMLAEAHEADFQTEDLDAYDLDCDDLSSAKAVRMANLSSCDPDVLSKLSIDNDQLLKQIMSQENVHIVVNSMDSLNVKKSRVNNCNKCLELETELFKKKDLIEKDVYDKLLKSYSTLEKHFISLDLATQLNQEVFQKDNFQSVENLDLNAQLQEKVFAIAALKNKLRKLKGKNVVDTAVSKPSAIIASGMFKLDIEPISHRLKNNKDVHENPSESLSEFACMFTKHVQELVKPTTSASGSKTSGNTKNNKIMRPPSSNKKNKVEDHSSKVKSSLNKMNSIFEPVSNALVKHSVRNAKFKFIYAICNKCLFDTNHDMCIVDYVNDVSVCSKSRSKRNKMRKVQKPTGKVFSEIGYSWKPTGRTFTIVRNKCPLTRITSTKVVPTKETSTKSVATPTQGILVYNRRPKATRTVGSSSKVKIVESKNSKFEEPKQSWGSTVFDVASSSLNDCSKFLGIVIFGNDHIAKIIGYGDYQMGIVTISWVYYMEGLDLIIDLLITLTLKKIFVSEVDVVPLIPKLRKNRTAHIDYIKHTQEEATTLRELVESERFLSPLNTPLAYACKYTRRIQELLMILQQTCPRITNLGTKLVAVTPKNQTKQVRRTPQITKSEKPSVNTSPSPNTDSNTPVLSSAGVALVSSASGSQYVINFGYLYSLQMYGSCYQELSKANTHLRTTSLEKIATQKAEIATLKAEAVGKKNSGPTGTPTKPKVLTSGMYTKSSKYIPPQKRADWVQPTLLPKKKQVTFLEPHRTSPRSTKKPPIQHKKPTVPVNMFPKAKPTTEARKPIPKRNTQNHNPLPAKSVKARRTANYYRNL